MIGRHHRIIAISCNRLIHRPFSVVLYLPCGRLSFSASRVSPLTDNNIPLMGAIHSVTSSNHQSSTSTSICYHCRYSLSLTHTHNTLSCWPWLMLSFYVSMKLYKFSKEYEEVKQSVMIFLQTVVLFLSLSIFVGVYHDFNY